MLSGLLYLSTIVICLHVTYHVKETSSCITLPGRLSPNPTPSPGYGGFPVRSAIDVALDLGPLDWLRWDM